MSAVSHTTLAEIVEDPCFAGYIDEAVRDTSQLIKSGIVQDNVLNKDVPEHARTVEVPFWPELDASDDTGADEVPSTAGEDLTTKKVEAKPDTGTTLLRSAKWGWSQFVSMYAAACKICNDCKPSSVKRGNCFPTTSVSSGFLNDQFSISGLAL